MEGVMELSGLRAKAVASALFLSAAGLAIAPSMTAQAAEFTPQQCEAIAGVTAKVVSVLGANTLSKEFRRSLAAFIVPDGKRATCTGPTDIVTPKGADIDAFNTIRSFLLEEKTPISLQKAGLRSVASAGSSPT